MNREKFNRMVSTEHSSWLTDAKKRLKYKRIRRFIFKVKVFYYVQKRAFLLFLHVVNARCFPHKHKWQTRGVNRYGTTTYRLCLKCRQTQQRVNKSYETERFEDCNPIPDLDAQFDEHDNFIYNGR